MSGRGYTPAEDAVLRRLRAMALRPAEMVGHFPGRSYKSLHARMRLIGLCADPLPRGPRPTRPHAVRHIAAHDADRERAARLERYAEADGRFAVALAGRVYTDRGTIGA